MRKRTGSNELVLLEGGFLLKEIFADNYEYEAYFKLINSTELHEYFPSEFEVEFKHGGKAPRLKYPKDRADLVVLIIPISSKTSSPKKRSELRSNAFQKYGGLIPKIRLEMKDELAMRKKLLVPDSEKHLIDNLVSKQRRLGLRRLKSKLADESGNFRRSGSQANSER